MARPTTKPNHITLGYNTATADTEIITRESFSPPRSKTLLCSCGGPVAKSGAPILVTLVEPLLVWECWI